MKFAIATDDGNILQCIQDVAGILKFTNINGSLVRVE